MDIRKTRTECYLRNPKSTFELHILLSADRNRQQAFDWTIIRVIIEHIITLAPYCPVTLYHRWPGVQDGKSMSPLPSFGPEWFTSKLPPGTLPPRPLPACAFGLSPAPPPRCRSWQRCPRGGSHGGPPGSTLTTPGIRPPPQSVLAMPVRCSRTSMVPCCGGDLWDSGVTVEPKSIVVMRMVYVHVSGENKTQFRKRFGNSWREWWCDVVCREM